MVRHPLSSAYSPQLTPNPSRYGPANYPLPRSVIPRGHLGEPSLKVLCLVDSQSDGPIGSPHTHVTLSTKDTVKTLAKELVATVSARSSVPHRIWKIQPGEFAGSQFPSKLTTHGAELLEINDKTLKEA